MARERGANQTVRRRGGLFAFLTVLLMIMVLALLAALFLERRNSGDQNTTQSHTINALRTQVSGQRQQLAAEQTIVAQQRVLIARLMKATPVRPTPTHPTNGPHSFLASFQIDKYRYVLFMQWQEADSFLKDGRLLTATNTTPQGAKQTLQLSGVDNNGSYGFTASGANLTLTFTGTLNNNGSLSINGVPWAVFSGFVGGTFSQTLHAGTLQDYTAAAAQLAKSGS